MKREKKCYKESCTYFAIVLLTEGVFIVAGIIQIVIIKPLYLCLFVLIIAQTNVPFWALSLLLTTKKLVLKSKTISNLAFIFCDKGFELLFS